MRKLKTAVGLMSGTSMDGIDAALLRTDGENAAEILGHYRQPYAAAFRQKLQQSLTEARAIRSAAERPGALAQTERELTLLHAQAVKALLAAHDYQPNEVDIIGFHGQTLLHRPPALTAADRSEQGAMPQNGFTLQLGDGALLARATGIAVIADMRQADMRAGGNGAPLIPAYHRALALKLRGQYAFPCVFVNIGGIANCTYIGAGGAAEFETEERLAAEKAKAGAEGRQAEAAADLIAFDCGPGNALLDQWAEARIGQFFDKGGEAALKGRILPWLLQTYLALPVFAQGRRSYDRADFPPLQDFLQNLAAYGRNSVAASSVCYEDGAATLAYMTAERIFHSFARLPVPPKTAIISGGGVRNRAIMADLRELGAKAGIEITAAENMGLDSEFMEAEAWGYLAVRSLYHLPLTYPATTGCLMPVSGGVLYPAPPAPAA